MPLGMRKLTLWEGIETVLEKEVVGYGTYETWEENCGARWGNNCLMRHNLRRQIVNRGTREIISTIAAAKK